MVWMQNLNHSINKSIKLSEKMGLKPRPLAKLLFWKHLQIFRTI